MSLNRSPSKNIYSLIQKLESAPPEIAAFIPYLLINHMVMNNLNDFIQHVGTKDISERNRITSCINSAYSVSLIFFGEPLTKKIFGRLKKTVSTTLHINFKPEAQWTYTVSNLFGGDIIREMNNRFNIDASIDNAVKPYMEPYFNKFYTHNQSYINSCIGDSSSDAQIINRFTQYFSTLKFDFNIPTIQAIKKEIQENKNTTQPLKSYVYFVLVSEKNAIRSYVIDHAFVIEQFYIEAIKKVYYRIYQSWLEQATLLDDFKSRQYNKHALDESEINHFLNNLEKYYCRNTAIEPISAKQCFGYDDSVPTLTAFDEKENVLSGTSVRYYSAAINPMHCLKNLRGFITSRPDLESKLSHTAYKEQSGSKLHSGPVALGSLGLWSNAKRQPEPRDLAVRLNSVRYR